MLLPSVDRSVKSSENRRCSLAARRPMRWKTRFTRERSGATAAMLLCSFKQQDRYRWFKIMDCNGNNINELQSAKLMDDKHWDSDKFYQMDKEIEHIKSKLLDCHIEYEQTEREIYDLNELKDKGTFVLQNTERSYNDLDEDLKEIHYNYMKCMKIVTTMDHVVQQTVNTLSSQRDNLRTELEQLKKTSEENNKKLMEVKKMIAIQEKKNIAMTKKLKNISKNVRINPELKERINAILNDPTIVKNTTQSAN